jgi:hypothetical protein
VCSSDAVRRPRSAWVLVAAACVLQCSTDASSPRQVSHSGAGAYEAALTATDDGFVAAWYDMRNGNGEIYIRTIDADGRPAGAEQRLTNDPAESYEPSIAALPGRRLALAWYDKGADGTLRAHVGVWETTGANIWTKELQAPGRNPVVAVERGAIVVAWVGGTVDGEKVRIARWTEAGEPIGESRLLGAAHPTTWNVNLVLAREGVAFVVWDSIWKTRASEVFLARVDAGATSVARLTADDGHESKYPDIALSGSDAALTWFDAKDGNTEVYLFTGAVSELTREIDQRAVRVTTTAGQSIGAYAAWNAGRIGLAWSDDTAGQHEVYFQQFDRSGVSLTEPVRVTDNSMSSLVPAIDQREDRFALAWNEFVPSSGGHDGRSEIAFALLR